MNMIAAVRVGPVMLRLLEKDGRHYVELRQNQLLGLRYLKSLADNREQAERQFNRRIDYARAKLAAAQDSGT